MSGNFASEDFMTRISLCGDGAPPRPSGAKPRFHIVIMARIP
jgi:hypothetical protein